MYPPLLLRLRERGRLTLYLSMEGAPDSKELVHTKLRANLKSVHHKEK